MTGGRAGWCQGWRQAGAFLRGAMMAKAKSFSDVYAARDIAIRAADQSGSATPIVSFLARYGAYLPMNQLASLAVSYLDVVPTAREERKAYLERTLDIGLSAPAGEGDRTVSTLVGRRDAAGNIVDFRTIRSDLREGEGFTELQSQIEDVLDAWKERYENEGFIVLDPVWRVDD